MSLVNWVEFQSVGDERGSMTVAEEDKNIPFKIKRIYYIYNTKPNIPRGFHAHIKLRQIAICVAGKCRMLLDDGKSRESVWLDHPSKGLVVSNGIWHEMHDFSKDCVLLMLASDYYDESDYIRDYDLFLKQVNS